MQDALKEMFASKKFIAMLAGIIITLAAKIGFDVDNETAMMIVGLVSSYVLGQGVADAGKSKAKLEAAQNVNPTNDG